MVGLTFSTWQDNAWQISDNRLWSLIERLDWSSGFAVNVTRSYAEFRLAN